MSRFYFGDSNSASDSDDDTLPYPTPLQRSDFLAPDFSAANYLSSLRNRHQTLEDLRSELRARSQLLSKELLDLVNSNYQDFLGLGRSLRGGDEKVEEVRVGLLGFKKEVESVKSKVIEREREVDALVDERVDIRKKIAFGRMVVDYDERLKLLEEQLMVETGGRIGYDSEDSEDDEEDEEDEGRFSMSLAKLRKHVMEYCLIQHIERSVGAHPFFHAQTPRIVKVRNTLLLDLGTALQQAKATSPTSAERVVKILNLYADMDESAEAVKVLKELKS